MVFGKLRENLAIKYNVFGLKQMDKLAVRNAIAAACGANLGLPQSAEVSFFLLAADKSIRQGMQKRLARKAFF